MNNDGLVDVNEVTFIRFNYNKETNEQGINIDYDINCDGILKVNDLAKIGFEYLTRTPPA